MRKIIFAALVIFTACRPQLSNEGPIAYGANGLSAPALYTVAPRPPRSIGSPAIAMAEQPVNERPVLPPLDSPVGENPQFPNRGFREPLTTGLNPDFTNSRPFPVSGLDPRFPLPVEQQVYDGVFAKEGEDAPYFNHDGDSVQISIREHPELSGEATINRDGQLRIPGTEDYVVARGKNNRQIATAVAQTVRPYTRRFPEVYISTVSAAGGYYYVLGGVKNQGRFPLGIKPLPLSEAVFRANSQLLDQRSLDAEGNSLARENYTLADKAALERVMVITPHRTAPQAETYNVAAALYGGVNGQNPRIKEGQIIVVGESGNLRLEDYIRQAMARDNQHTPRLKTYDVNQPYLDSPLLNTYAKPR